MRKQPYPIQDLTGGLNVTKDPLMLLDKEFVGLENVRYSKKLLRKDVAWNTNEFGDNLPLDGTPMYSDTFYTYAGDEYPLVMTTKWIYFYSGTLDRFIVKNPTDFDSSSQTLTYSASAQTITRSSGSFLTDGFAEGDVITTSQQSGHFTIASVSALVITINEDYITDQGPVSGTVYHLQALTGDEDDQFSVAVTLDGDGDDVIFVTNGNDLVLRWEGTGLFTFVADTYCKTLLAFKNRLIQGHTIEGGTECPKRIKWSVLGDVDDFSGTGSGSFDIVETSDWVVHLSFFKDKAIVVKERSLWELVYVGGTVYFTYSLLLDGVGTNAPLTFIALGEEMIFFGNDNFYLYDLVSLKPIGDQLFDILYNTETKIVDGTHINRAAAIYIEELEEYWVALPIQGASTSTVLKYSFLTDSWTRKSKAVVAWGYYSENAKPDWSELVGNWEDQTWEWRTRVLPAGAPTTLVMYANGYIYEDDRVTHDNDYMKIESKDWMFAYSQRWVECHIEAKGGDFNVRYSIDVGQTWSSTFAFSADEDEFRNFVMYLNETSRTLRIKIESTAEDLVIKWIEPWYIPRQKNYQQYEVN